MEINFPTVPTTMGLELRTNPMLRWKEIGVSVMGMDAAEFAGAGAGGGANESEAKVFAEVRKRKDNF